MRKQSVKLLAASALILSTVMAPVAFAADSVTVKVPDWVSRIKLGGDLRLRYQGDLYDENNGVVEDPENPGTALDTTHDHHRYRYRLRLDGSSKLYDSGSFHGGKVEAVVRLASGNDESPVSTNETMGDYSSKDDLWIDRAFLRATYQGNGGSWAPYPKLTFQGGRIPNPMYASKGLVWDEDLNFEGASVKMDSDGREITSWNTFLTLGVFPIQYVSDYQGEDKWLYAAQVGMEVRPIDRLKGVLSVAYYDYQNIEGEVNTSTISGWTNYSVPKFQQKGNTGVYINKAGDSTQIGLVSDYNMVDITGKLTLNPYSPVSVSLIGDAVVNTAFDKDEIVKKYGSAYQNINEDVLGYQVGLECGYSEIREFGQWAGSMYYRYLEGDAVLDSFTDSDFHGGGTNAKGWIASFDYGIFKNSWLGFKWMTADEIEGIPLSIDVVQLDLTARF